MERLGLAKTLWVYANVLTWVPSVPEVARAGWGRACSAACKVVKALKAAGLKSVPTGMEHGTVTGVSERRPYEITTLRRDVETDGRRAVEELTGIAPE